MARHHASLRPQAVLSLVVPAGAMLSHLYWSTLGDFTRVVGAAPGLARYCVPDGTGGWGDPATYANQHVLLIAPMQHVAAALAAAQAARLAAPRSRLSVLTPSMTHEPWWADLAAAGYTCSPVADCAEGILKETQAGLPSTTRMGRQRTPPARPEDRDRLKAARPRGALEPAGPLLLWQYGHNLFEPRRPPEMSLLPRPAPAPAPSVPKVVLHSPVKVNLEACRHYGYLDRIIRYLDPARGVPVDFRGDPAVERHPPYPLEGQALTEAIRECDRQLERGVLRELRPGEELIKVHPTIVVPQGDKFRYCIDCSTGVNPGMAPLPWPWTW